MTVRWKPLVFLSGVFLIVGLIGLVWALAWWFIYRDPERHRAIAPKEVDALLAQRSAPVAPDQVGKVSWLDLFRYRSVWGLMIGLFCLNFAIYFFITWFPSYLLQARGFSLTSLGTLGMVPLNSAHSRSRGMSRSDNSCRPFKPKTSQANCPRRNKSR